MSSTEGRGLKAFAKNEDGVFAVLFGLMAIVLIALAGSAIDFTRWAAARNAAQDAADAGVLAAAVSSVEEDDEVTEVVAGFANPALQRWNGLTLTSATYDPATRRVTAEVSGTVDTFFVGLVGVNTLPVTASATAERATNGQLELALVLDNTFSMASSDGSGSTKMASLKNAANLLITTLWEDENENIRVGLVPYAQYVNVGTNNRSQPWMSVAADKTTTSTPSPRTCETRTTKEECVNGPKHTCTRYKDGVPETYTCYPERTCTMKTVAPYEYCTGGGSPTTTTTTWFGCVQSRKKATIRLTDNEPYTPYIGITQSKPTCLTPIIPLTGDVGTLRAGINGMVYTNPLNSGYIQQTYIPQGMLWGINVVSPTAPFSEGLAYDTENREPRKAIVLMTDGDNTLRYDNGNHSGYDSNYAALADTQAAQTDADTLTLCTYAKNNQVEVFTVSFGVIDASSMTMLQNCATDAEHYFAATSSAQLNEAFENIADQLRVVRIVD